MIYHDYFKKIFEGPKRKVTIVDSVNQGVMNQSIKVYFADTGSIKISPYSHYCGGLFFSAITFNQYNPSREQMMQMAEEIKPIIKYLQSNDGGRNGMIGYITKREQVEVKIVLKYLGFKPLICFINPNTGNNCTQWMLIK
jgi:hypothetical protein